MTTINEGNLKFSFEYEAIKYDDQGSYYKQKFIKVKSRIKAVDIVTVHEHIGYLIEIKDYTHPNTKDLRADALIDSVIDKVLCSLSAIIPVKINSGSNAEQNTMTAFADSQKVTFVLHIEIPPPRRDLKQSCFDFHSIQLKLKQRLKPVCNNVKVVSKGNLKGLPWAVSNLNV